MGHVHPHHFDLRSPDGLNAPIGPAAGRRLRIRLDPLVSGGGRVPLLLHPMLVRVRAGDEVERPVGHRYEYARPEFDELTEHEDAVLRYVDDLVRAGWQDVHDRRAVVSFERIRDLFEHLQRCDVVVEDHPVVVDPVPVSPYVAGLQPHEVRSYLDPVYVWRNGVVLDADLRLRLLDLGPDEHVHALHALVERRRRESRDATDSQRPFDYVGAARLERERCAEGERRLPAASLQVCVAPPVAMTDPFDLRVDLVLHDEAGAPTGSISCPDSVEDARRIARRLTPDEEAAIVAVKEVREATDRWSMLRALGRLARLVPVTCGGLRLSFGAAIEHVVDGGWFRALQRTGVICVWGSPGMVLDNTGALRVFVESRYFSEKGISGALAEVQEHVEREREGARHGWTSWHPEQALPWSWWNRGPQHASHVHGG